MPRGRRRPMSPGYGITSQVGYGTENRHASGVHFLRVLGAKAVSVTKKSIFNNFTVVLNDLPGEHEY